MKASEYWKQRFEQLEVAQNQIGGSALGEVIQQYNEAQKQIEGKIALWYQRFAYNNEITIAEARKWLSSADLSELKWDIQEYIKYGQDNALMGGWMKELENASAKYHISKLEALKIHTQHSLEVMFSKQMGTVTGALSNVFESGYYHTAYELQHGFNIGWDIAGINQNQLEKILSKPWAVDGKNFSQRIWDNRSKLISEVHTQLTQNIMLGDDPQKAIDALAKKMKTSRYNAGRLIMTEEAYFSSLSQKECFNDLDVEEYEILATLDSHTSEICRSLDGQVFPMKDYEPGVTAPPFHVWCRSTTVPRFKDNFEQFGERAARDEETGKTYYVPDDMNYQEWKETFVDGGDKSGLDVFDDGSTIHYTRHKEPEQPKPKKEYLTKKKLQAYIANAEAEIEELEHQFHNQTNGLISFEEFKKDYGSDYSSISYDTTEEKALKAIGEQIDVLNNQKVEWQAKLNEKLVKEQKKALIKQQLELEEQKAVVQQELDNFEIKTYSGIWKDDKTTADWASLNIEGKKKYYEGKFITESDPDLMKKYQDFYNQLQELDVEGKAYDEIRKELKQIDKQISKVQSDLKKFETNGIMDVVGNAFSQERKDAAIWAKSTKEADALLRDKCGEIWRTSTSPPIQKNAIFDYTQSYHKFNEPLRGIEYGTEKFLGVGNVDLDQIGVKYAGWKPGAMRKEIEAMTDIIEKSVYEEDFWLQRGCRFKGMDKFFNVPMDKLQWATQDELEALLLGTTPTEYGFCSCGVAKGKGFSGDIILNIYAPSGTQMMYVEPFSAFGNGSGKAWDGISKQASFGQESEIVLQQGTTFRVVKVEKTPRMIYVDLEVIGQNPQR